MDLTSRGIRERFYETSIGVVRVARPARPDDVDEMWEFEEEFCDDGEQ